jgi:ATP-dependent DNA ligase
VRCSPVLEASLSDLIQSIRAQGLEGLVAKRSNSRYEPGQRSGALEKMRVNRSREFIIGGYSVGGSTFDAVIVGHVEEDNEFAGTNVLDRTALVRGYDKPGADFGKPMYTSF